MKEFSLNGRWDALCIMPSGETFMMEGKVPGSSISDLMRAERLDKDLFFRG
ncbi:MAG: hypothetical protein IJC48_07355 [Clostridia bacterium]|nr:hypothetical protein [Clostridia bacterium]